MGQIARAPLRCNLRPRYNSKMENMAKTRINLADETDMQAFAAKLARLVQAGDVILLHGTLGMGKSALARALIRTRARAPEHEVPSPTFTLVQIYEFDTGPDIWHFDLYRLSDPEEVHELNIEDAFAEGVSLIEWPDRLGHLTPDVRLDIYIESGTNPNARVLTLHGFGERGLALQRALQRALQGGTAGD